MKQIVLSSALIVMFLASGCQNDKKPNTGTSKLESFADSLFQASIDSVQISGAAILVYQNGRTIL
jgi:hypothetical protein